MLFNYGRRRSDRFAELLEEGDGRRRRHRRSEDHDELISLVAVAAAIGTVTEAPDATEDFRLGLRAMLMANIEREGIGAGADEKAARAERFAATRAALVAKTEVVRQVRPVRPTHTGRARAAAIAGVMVGALTLSGVSAASTSAVPGDTLYQVKRSAERAQLAFAGSDQSRGRLYLEFANSRVSEAGHVDDSRLDDVFADVDAETIAGVSLLTPAAAAGDKDATGAITQFVTNERTRLTAFAAAVPASAEPIRRSLALLSEIEARDIAITDAVAKGCEFPSNDRLGPKPAPQC